jgi:small subunit ribosomal protein S6
MAANQRKEQTLNTYEIAVLYHPDLEIDLEKSAQKVIKIVTENKGKITAEDNWGKRKMAYKIKGHDHALYVFYKAEIPSEAVKKVEASLNITDEVIRFLITKPDIKAIAKAEAIKSAKNAKVNAAKTSEDAHQEINEKPVKKVVKKVGAKKKPTFNKEVKAKTAKKAKVETKPVVKAKKVAKTAKATTKPKKEIKAKPAKPAKKETKPKKTTKTKSIK